MTERRHLNKIRRVLVELEDAMRTGVTLGGRQLDDAWMPYQTLFDEMTDEEWEAIWLFLQTLPPKEQGNR